jgi:hypothetical protein
LRVWASPVAWGCPNRDEREALASGDRRTTVALRLGTCVVLGERLRQPLAVEVGLLDSEAGEDAEQAGGHSSPRRALVAAWATSMRRR